MPEQSDTHQRERIENASLGQPATKYIQDLTDDDDTEDERSWGPIRPIANLKISKDNGVVAPTPKLSLERSVIISENVDLDTPQGINWTRQVRLPKPEINIEETYNQKIREVFDSKDNPDNKRRSFKTLYYSCGSGAYKQYHCEMIYKGQCADPHSVKSVLGQKGVACQTAALVKVFEREADERRRSDEEKMIKTDKRSRVKLEKREAEERSLDEVLALFRVGY